MFFSEVRMLNVTLVVADVMEAYLKEKWVVMVEPSEHKIRYWREPVPDLR
jgi:hypothetical protein